MLVIEFSMQKFFFAWNSIRRKFLSSLHLEGVIRGRRTTKQDILGFSE